MKTKQRLLAMLLMMLFMGMKMMAATNEAYAVYVASSKTLTFYYDTQKSTRPGTAYSLNTGNNNPEWYDENNTVEVQKVVFHSSFKDARPTSTYAWFANKTTLTSIVDIKYLNTSEVTNMSDMFTGCDNLTDIDVTGFDTSKVTDMSRMFSWTGIKEIDVSNFNTSRVTKMTSMFALTDLVTLDLSNFDTRKVVDMRLMFFGNPDLTTIYVGRLWSTASLPEEYDGMDWMFRSCDNLKGGAGTTFDSKHDGKEYAHIDEKSNPGYLSVHKYDLRIAGTQVTYANKNDILGNGIFAYEPTSKTLTINGIYRTEYSPIIRSSIDGLIIQGGLTADLSLKNNGTIIALYNNTTIKSDGLMILESDDKNSNEVYAIDVYSGNLTINNVDNMVIMSMCGIVSTSYNGKLTIKSSNIIFKCERPEYSLQAAMAVYGLGSGIKLLGSKISYPDDAVLTFDGSVNHNNGTPATYVVIVPNNDITTNLKQVTSDKSQVISDEWYTIDGRKLNGKPAKKGIYIHNGKKAVVR